MLNFSKANINEVLCGHLHKPLPTYIHGLPRRKLLSVLCTTEEILLSDGIPSRVAVLVRDLVAYRNRVHKDNHNEMDSGKVKKRGFLNIYFHNKGMDMKMICRQYYITEGFWQLCLIS